MSYVENNLTQGETVLHQRIVLTPLRKSWIAQQVRWGWLR